jgi:hypothetical protein
MAAEAIEAQPVPRGAIAIAVEALKLALVASRRASRH